MDAQHWILIYTNSELLVHQILKPRGKQRKMKKKKKKLQTNLP